jgi:endonuclease/exonuclease/phosphatase (EEP) superfamily protein YafD
LDFQNSQVNDCIYSDIEIDGKLTRVFNVHYESVHLANQDYATIDSLESAQSTRWSAIRSILRKMKYANLRRAVQAEDVAELVNSFDGRSIVCGDFNDIPVSYTYHHTKGNLQDAFVLCGNGYGATYVNNFPLFRIDYVLLDEQIQVKSYQRIEKVLSDHLGVVVGFE